MLERGVNLVGRQGLIEQLACQMGQDKALVTLHGAPGVGKSALAGAWLCGQDALRVDLCGVQRPEDAAALLVRALEGKMPEEGGLDAIMDRVVAASAGAPKLWLIEHLDHLAEPLAPWLARLHLRLDAVRWLITSRQPLHVQSERVLEVPPLRWDAQDPHTSPAGALFCQRAQLDPQSLDGSERAALAKVLELTSGVALAIELAAARHRYLGLEALAQELEQGLLKMRSKMRDVPQRHRTLTGALELSWSALGPQERRALGALTVLVGSFDRDAALAVMGPDVDGDEMLEALCDRALLQIHHDKARVHFSLLEPVRAFVVQNDLSEVLQEAAQRHAAFFTRDACQWFDDIRRTSRRIARCHAVQPQLEAIWQAHIHSASQAGCQYSLSAALLLSQFYADNGPDKDGIWRLRRALEQSQAHDDALTVALRQRVQLALTRMEIRRRGLIDEDRTVLEGLFKAVEHSDPPLACHALYALAFALDVKRDPEGVVLFERVIELAQGPSKSLAGQALRLRAGVIGRQGEALLQSALEIFEQCNDAYGKTLVLSELGTLHAIYGQQARGFELLDQATAQARVLGIKMLVLYIKRLRARACVATDDMAQAAELLQEILVADLSLDRRWEACFTTLQLSWVLLESGRVNEALSKLARLSTLSKGLAMSPRVEDIQRLLQAKAAMLQGASSQEGVEALEAVAKRHPGKRFRGASLLALAWRSVEAHVHPAANQPPQARFCAEGGWFECVRRDRVHLQHRQALKDILAALVQHRTQHPGQGLDVNTLFEAGWPGQQIQFESMRSRVYAAIRALRKMGLQDILVRLPEQGYALDPVVEVEIVNEGVQGTQIHIK